MSPAAELRPATGADLDAIMALEVATFGTDSWSTETMRRDLADRDCYYLVAEWDVGSAPSVSTLAGYAGVLAPPGSGDADVQTIAVAPSARRRGIGRTLMLALIAEARARRAKTVFLEVRADNPGAATLYRSLGFEHIATRERYYQPDGIDAEVMRLGLPPTGIGDP